MTKVDEGAIENLLLHAWDPIGIVDVAAAQDEYRGFAVVIAGMMARGASRGLLVQKMLDIERSEMGLPGDAERAERVVDVLLKIQT
jgi:hypothetical protein